ncbi:MAG: prenyltransferase/squalene oxidase repeat-containing protein, partial [Oscillospiraceae bacterium]
IKNILKFQKANGGFSQKENEEPNFEATAFAITALSTYKNIVAFAKPLEDAVNFLSTAQMKNGSFGKYENSESLCSAIIALNSMEIDLSDKRFNKGKLSLIEHLNSYKLKDGSYSDIKGGKSSLNSTRLAVIALSSIKKSDNPYILREPIENSKPQQTKVASSLHYIRDNSFKIMVGALTLIVIAIAVIIVSHKITKRKKTE